MREKKRGDFFDFYCRENVPLAFLAVNEGGLTRAIARITDENKRFYKVQFRRFSRDKSAERGSKKNHFG